MKLVARYFPAGRPTRLLGVVTIIDSAGSGMYLAGSSIFAVTIVGLTPSQVGWSMTCAGLLGLVGAIPMARIADRVGVPLLLFLIQIWQAIFFCVLAFVSGILSFLVATSCIAIGQTAYFSLNQAAVGIFFDENDRVKTMGLLRSARNGGLTVGALAAAPLVGLGSSFGFRALILLNAMSFIVTAAMLSRLRNRGRMPVSSVHAESALNAGRRLGLGRLRSHTTCYPFALLNGIFSLHISILVVGIPLWLMQATTVPTSLVAVLTALNTGVALVLQVPVSERIGTVRLAKRALSGAGALLATCSLAIGLAGSAGMRSAAVLLTAATAMLTIGEVLQSAGSWEISYRYSRPGRQAEDLAVFNMGYNAQIVLGPLLLTGAVIKAGQLGWFGLAASFVLAILLIGPITHRLEISAGRKTDIGNDATAVYRPCIGQHEGM